MTLRAGPVVELSGCCSSGSTEHAIGLVLRNLLPQYQKSRMLKDEKITEVGVRSDSVAPSASPCFR